MIELIMAVGSLLLVLGVFSVIVKTYLEEFSEGTLSERKWADVQTFFTYVNLDLENTYLGLVENGTPINITTTSPDSITITGVDSDNEAYSKTYLFDSGDNGIISRDGAVVLRGNDNFSIKGIGMSVYTKSIGDGIKSNWSNYVTTGDSLSIGSDEGSNYYIEPVITLTDESKITGGYALRFDNVTESEETEIYNQDHTEKELKDSKTITIENSSYDGLIKTLTLTAYYDNGNNPIKSVTYTDKGETEYKKTTEDKTVSPGEYIWSSVSIGSEMKFEFDMKSNGNQNVTIKVTISD
jgi:hypothetical protein